MRIVILIMIVGAFLLLGIEILTCLVDDAEMTKEWEKDIDESLRRYKDAEKTDATSVANEQLDRPEGIAHRSVDRRRD